VHIRAWQIADGCVHGEHMAFTDHKLFPQGQTRPMAARLF